MIMNDVDRLKTKEKGVIIMTGIFIPEKYLIIIHQYINIQNSCVAVKYMLELGIEEWKPTTKLTGGYKFRNNELCLYLFFYKNPFKVLTKEPLSEVQKQKS